jgi:hypothetical protein
MSLKGIQTTFAVLCGLGLLALSSILAYFTLWARIDTPDDREFMWQWDTLLGLLIAAAVFLIGGRRRSNLATFAQAAGTWVFVSGLFLVCHETQVRFRWTVPPRLMARHRVRTAQVALEEYARDCGGFPSQEQGLVALRTNPGVPGWAGPYIEERDLTDPWGNALQYRADGDRVQVWSNGPNGKSGTNDDIRMDDTDHDRIER